MINPPGYPWAPLGTYTVPLVDAHSVALGANFIVSWTILKISKPTTISGEYVFFYQVDLFVTPSHPRVPIVYPQPDAYLGTLEANFFVSWVILKISKPTKYYIW